MVEEVSALVCSRALQALCRHLDYSLLKELWQQLCNGFLHEKIIFLFQACHDWMSLCVLDFPDISSFNSELHYIYAQLRLCEEILTKSELISKTLSTFPLASTILAQQYRNMKFRTHAKLMFFQLLVEKKHQILVKQAEAKPAQAQSIPSHQPRLQVLPRKRDKSKPNSVVSAQSRGQSHEERAKPNPRATNVAALGMLQSTAEPLLTSSICIGSSRT